MKKIGKGTIIDFRYDFKQDPRLMIGKDLDVKIVGFRTINVGLDGRSNGSYLGSPVDPR